MSPQAADLLRRVRRNGGLSQRSLARAAGVPPSTVSRIESEEVDPTVGMLERLLGAAGLGLALATASGAPSLAWLALRSDHRDLDWTAARSIADWVSQHPTTAGAAIGEPPPATGSLVVDNMMAAIAETIADDHRLLPPTWCQRLPPLDTPWSPPGTPAMRERWRRATLSRFAARNLWCAADSIWRGRRADPKRSAATA